MSDSHRPEAEIIPPGAGDPARWRDQRRQTRPEARVWVWSSDQHGTRLRYGRPGPLGLFALFVALSVLGALGFFVFLGLAAITLPIIAALVLAGLIVGVIRRL
jgi:hypothetical protein